MEVKSINQRSIGPAVHEENASFDFAAAKIEDHKEALIPEGTIMSVTLKYAYYPEGPYNPSAMIKGVQFYDRGLESKVIGINRTTISADENRKVVKAKTVGLAGLVTLLNRTSTPVYFGCNMIAGPAPIASGPRNATKRTLEITVKGEHSDVRRWALYDASPILFQDNPSLMWQNAILASVLFDDEMRNLRWTISPFLAAMGALCICRAGDDNLVIGEVNALMRRLFAHLTLVLGLTCNLVEPADDDHLATINFVDNADYKTHMQECVLLGSECVSLQGMGNTLAAFKPKALQAFANHQRIMLDRIVGPAWNNAGRGEAFYCGFGL